MVRTPDSPLLREEERPGDIELSAGVAEAEVLTLGPQARSFRPRHRPSPSRTRCYVAYCVVCLAVTGALLVATLWEGWAPRSEAHWWRRRLRPWEEAGESFVGAALCAETLGPLRVLGVRLFLQDRWRLLDAAVAALTLLCGFFFLFRRVVHHVEDVVEDIDVPMLGMRFALQPIRILSTASMVVRARRRQMSQGIELPRAPPVRDPRRPAAVESALTPELASEIRELLPVTLRFLDWELIYCPSVHGTSLQTFYRQQVGPNILVVRDAHGGLFGGFAAEPWRPETGAYGFRGEAFVFVSRQLTNPIRAAPPCPGQSPKSSTAGGEGDCFHALDGTPVPVDDPDERQTSVARTASSGSVAPSPALDVFWAISQRGHAVQWSDSKMFGFGRAMVVCEDFLRGSSHNCEAFLSPPLSSAGDDFIIRSLECWHVGAGRDD